MGSTPMDVGQSNLAKSGQISRNALCPCGSKKRYKRFDASSTSCITKLICHSLIDDLSNCCDLHVLCLQYGYPYPWIIIHTMYNCSVI
jgi:hypothetical protein